MRRAVALVLLALIGLDCFRPIADYDVCWHLAAGRIMLDRGEVLTTDPLTWTLQGQRWVNHEWLAQVLFALAERADGLTGVRLLTSLIIVAGFLVLYVLAERRTRSVLLASAVVALGFVLFLFRIRERPDVWTPFFLYSVYAVLLREDLSAARKAAVAVVVAAVWVNLHAGALVTPLLLGAIAVGSWTRSRRDAWVYLAAAFASALAVCASPNGWWVWKFALTARGQTQLAPEWRSLWSFPAAEYLREKVLFAAIVAAWAFALLRSWRKQCLSETLASLLAVAMAASTIRLLYLLVLPALQVARLLAQSRLRNPVAAAVIVCCACIALSDLQERTKKYEALRLSFTDDLFYPNFPVKAVDFLSDHPLTGRGYVPPGWAGYLSWRLWPRYLTFVDGRTADFGDRLSEDAYCMLCARMPGEDPLSLIQRQEKRNRLLDDYGIDWVLAQRPNFEDDAECAGKWVPVYQDAIAVILVRAPEKR